MSSGIRKNGRNRKYWGGIEILNRRIKQSLTEKITFEHLSKDQEQEEQIVQLLQGRAFFPSRGTVTVQSLQGAGLRCSRNSSVAGAE